MVHYVLRSAGQKSFTAAAAENARKEFVCFENAFNLKTLENTERVCETAIYTRVEVNKHHYLSILESKLEIRL